MEMSDKNFIHVAHLDSTTDNFLKYDCVSVYTVKAACFATVLLWAQTFRQRSTFTEVPRVIWKKIDLKPKKQLQVVVTGVNHDLSDPLYLEYTRKKHPSPMMTATICICRYKNIFMFAT